MAYKRTVIFTVPDISRAATVEEAIRIIQQALQDFADKLNRELTVLERSIS